MGLQKMSQKNVAVIAMVQPFSTNIAIGTNRCAVIWKRINMGSLNMKCLRWTAAENKLPCLIPIISKTFFQYHKKYTDNLLIISAFYLF